MLDLFKEELKKQTEIQNQQFQIQNQQFQQQFQQIIYWINTTGKELNQDLIDRKNKNK